MANYPRQPAPQLYPTQQYPQYSYPTGQPFQQYQQPMGQVPSAPPIYNEPPPPYTQYPTQTAAPPPQPMMHPGQYPPAQYPVQQTIVAPGLFDSGARFDGASQPRIPPPPPGVTPNAAQMASMHGHRVIGTQQSENFFSGNRNDGGYTFW